MVNSILAEIAAIQVKLGDVATSIVNASNDIVIIQNEMKVATDNAVRLQIQARLIAAFDARTAFIVVQRNLNSDLDVKNNSLSGPQRDSARLISKMTSLGRHLTDLAQVRSYYLLGYYNTL